MMGRTLQHADGTLENIPACQYPHYAAGGEIEGAGAVKVEPETINGWVEDASVTTSTSYGEIVATWTVPPGPTTNVGQTVYFFPGMEDTKDVVSIIQPVLQWGSSKAGGGNYWAIASWNCCPSGIADYSTPVTVNPGDTIQGTVKSTCGAGIESCPTWNITTADTTSGKSSNLSNSPSEGQTFNWAFGGVLEAYNIAYCIDYPLSGPLTFSNIGLYDYNFHQISNPAWTTSWDTSVAPLCGYDVTTAATKVTVHLPTSYSINCGAVNFGTVHGYPDFGGTTCINTINDTWNYVGTVYVYPPPPQYWVIGGPSRVNPDQNFQLTVGWEPRSASPGFYSGDGYLLYEDANGNYLYAAVSYSVTYTP